MRTWLSRALGLASGVPAPRALGALLPVSPSLDWRLPGVARGLQGRNTLSTPRACPTSVDRLGCSRWAWHGLTEEGPSPWFCLGMCGRLYHGQHIEAL